MAPFSGGFLFLKNKFGIYKKMLKFVKKIMARITHINTLHPQYKSWVALFKHIIADAPALLSLQPGETFYHTHVGEEGEVDKWEYSIDYVKARIFDELGLFTGTMTERDVLRYDREVQSYIVNSQHPSLAQDIIDKHRQVVRYLINIAKKD